MTQYAGLLANFVCALAFTSIGFIVRSWWFITVGAYYAVLAAARFSVLKIKRGARGDLDLELFSKKVTGILLIVLSFCLVGVNILAAIKDRGTVFHEIVMIAIATYTCAKVTLAIIDMVKARKIASPAVKTLRSIFQIHTVCRFSQNCLGGQGDILLRRIQQRIKENHSAQLQIRSHRRAFLAVTIQLELRRSIYTDTKRRVKQFLQSDENLRTSTVRELFKENRRFAFFDRLSAVGKAGPHQRKRRRD